MDYHKAFLQLSEKLTGFSPQEIHSTGLLEEYFDYLGKVLGGSFRKYLEALSNENDNHQSINCAPAELEKFRQQVIMLWYSGNWYPEFPLPEDMTEPEKQAPRRVSIRSYQEALVWRAIGKNPSGAKWPGWGSWATQPNDPADKLF